MDVIALLGRSGIAGFLFGVLVVIWVNPATPGGKALLLATSACAFVLAWIVLSQIARAVAGALRRTPPAPSDPHDPPADG